jgi:hypothetical protein
MMDSSMLGTILPLIILLALAIFIGEKITRKRSKTNYGPKYICSNCGYAGKYRTITKGSFFIEIILWILMILPGLIYTVWRVSSRYKACPQCDAPNMIPVSSPRGKKLLEEFGQENI